MSAPAREEEAVANKPANPIVVGAYVEDEIRRGRPNLYKSFLLTRLLVGVVGVLLPTFIVAWDLGSDAWNHQPAGLRGSLSAYYYHQRPLSDWFVGSLWAIGVGLLVYMGTRKSNASNLISIGAGVAALVVSLFPTDDGGTVPEWVSNTHYLAAGALIIGLGFLCMGFGVYDNEREDADSGAPTRWPWFTKRGRRWIHYGAAAVIGSMVLLVLAIKFISPLQVSYLGSHGVLIAELGAVYAFAVSWAMKGLELWEYSQSHPTSPNGAPLTSGVLTTLSNGDARSSDIATTLQVRPQAVLRAADALEREGLVENTRAAIGPDSALLRLTARGRELLGQSEDGSQAADVKLSALPPAAGRPVGW